MPSLTKQPASLAKLIDRWRAAYATALAGERHRPTRTDFAALFADLVAEHRELTRYLKRLGTALADPLAPASVATLKGAVRKFDAKVRHDGNAIDLAYDLVDVGEAIEAAQEGEAAYERLRAEHRERQRKQEAERAAQEAPESQRHGTMHCVRLWVQSIHEDIARAAGVLSVEDRAALMRQLRDLIERLQSPPPSGARRPS